VIRAAAIRGVSIVSQLKLLDKRWNALDDSSRRVSGIIDGYSVLATRPAGPAEVRSSSHFSSFEHIPSVVFAQRSSELALQ
jgi:hypothetical protein